LSQAIGADQGSHPNAAVRRSVGHGDVDPPRAIAVLVDIDLSRSGHRRRDHRLDSLSVRSSRFLIHLPATPHQESGKQQSADPTSKR
jgi:hypothetical protein